MPPGAQVLQLLKPMHLEAVLGDRRNHGSEKLEHRNQRGALTCLNERKPMQQPSAAQNKCILGKQINSKMNASWKTIYAEKNLEALHNNFPSRTD